MTKTENNCIRNCANVNLINRGIEGMEKHTAQIKRTSEVLNLLGNATRLKILYLIKTEKKVCVCDMSDILGISVSAISQQLKKLKDGNLLTSEKTGQTIFYQLHSEIEEILHPIFELFNEKTIAKVG